MNLTEKWEREVRADFTQLVIFLDAAEKYIYKHQRELADWAVHDARRQVDTILHKLDIEGIL